MAGIEELGQIALAAARKIKGRVKSGVEVGQDVIDSILQTGTDVASAAKKAAPKAGSTGRGKKPPIKGVDLPSLRTLPVDEAVKIARKQPHLIPSGGTSEGAYIGGPRTIQGPRDLGKMRRNLDEYIAADPRGGDWYDRYRAGVNEVTGGDPMDTLWMTNLEGQYSAGVSPDGELGFALKDNNAMIANGDPGKPARPAQAKASIRAAAANDPMQFQLGPKTGEYAKRVDPNRQGVDTATGVNDFRHLANLGYTETDGSSQRNAVGAAGHRFADYETALAVDRANKAGLDGRSNWTGEQLQAAPWVRQKALALLDRGRSGYSSDAALILKAQGRAATGPELDAMAYELAFKDANKTIADFFPKHTAFATHEAQPYRFGGHLPGAADASAADKAAFAADPRSDWRLPDGRDALYAGMRHRDTGYAMRVQPSTEMQGVYPVPGTDIVETNPGSVARPLVAFDAGKVKSLPAADRGLLDAVEATRGYLDYQGATPWHKPWVGGQPGQSNSLLLTRPSQQASTPEEMMWLKALGEQHGLPDVIDNGQGFTMTNFGGEGLLSNKSFKAVSEAADQRGGFAPPQRAKVDSGYPGYEGTWEQGYGSGAATDQFLGYLSNAPQGAIDALDANPYLAQKSLDRLDRDAEWASKFGATRQDVQNARQIVGSGPGWVQRLKDARASGVILPALAGAILLPALQSQPQGIGGSAQ